MRMKVSVVFALLIVLANCERKSIQNVHIALAGDNTKMAISWLTQDQTSTSVVYYGTTSGVYPFTATSTDQTSYDSKAGWNHNVVITNLLPNTQYFYTCGDQTYAISSEFNFTTYQNTFVGTTIAVYGDLGIDNSQNTISQLTTKATNDEFDLFVHLGDISYANDHPLQYERTWNTWFSSMQSAMAHIPYMVSVGNHESWCRDPVCAVQTYNFTTYNQKFRMPGVESGSGTNMFYSFDYYNIHFIAISTETDYPGAPGIDPSPEPKEQFQQAYLQQNWLISDLEAAVANRANVPWIIFFGHRPVYAPNENTNGVPTGQAAKVQAFFEPLMKQYKVDLYLAGHVHAYARTYPVFNNTITSTSFVSPAATVHVTAGGAGNREGISSFPTGTQPGNPSWYANGNDETYGYGSLVVHNNTALTWNYYRSDSGALIDTFTLTKNQ